MGGQISNQLSQSQPKDDRLIHDRYDFGKKVRSFLFINTTFSILDHKKFPIHSSWEKVPTERFILQLKNPLKNDSRGAISSLILFYKHVQ
jgi:hypothetical protein